MMDELVEVTAEWDDLGEGERAGWSMDWEQFAHEIVPEVTEEYTQGLMNQAQEKRYRKLIDRIEQHRDLIKRFGLTMPRIPVET